MNLPLVLQDINNNIIGKNIIVSNGNFFIKSYKKFNIELLLDYDYDLDGNVIVSEINPLDDPKIYSVINPDNIQSNQKFYGVNSNYSYTIYLGKSQKQVLLRISDFEFPGDDIFVTINYEPENELLDYQEHYNTLLINNNLPTYNELKPAIVDENHQEIIKRLLLDFKQIIKYKGTIKSIQQFLYFIGFNPDSIKILPEYITPNKIRTINPNKETDVKTGYYHIIYDAFEWRDTKYNSKNLPNIVNTIEDFKEFFDKLLYALLLANDYFTINEQQMSFFGTNNMFNAPKFLSLTTQFTNVQKFDVINFKNNIDINIYNRTLIDSKPKDIVKNNILINKKLQLSEVKIWEGNHIKQNPVIYLIDLELSDNYNDTNLTDEQETEIKYVFGNVLNINIDSNYSQVKYFIKNLDNELIQYTSELFQLNNNDLQNKIVIESAGKYLITFHIWDYKGTRFEYFYELEINQTNIDFDIFNSKVILFDGNNKMNQKIDSPIITKDINTENNLLLLNSDTNNLLQSDLKNYFNVTDNFDTLNLLGKKQFKMPLLNHNIKMNDLTETLVTDYIDNFLHIISIKKIPQCNYEFSDNLFVKELDIQINDLGNTEQHFFISTKENSININEFLHHIKIVYNNITYNVKDILLKKLPIEFEYKNATIPVNFDFTLDNNNINSVFPRLENIENIEDTDFSDSISLKLGDIIVCSIDHKYIVNFTDVNWKIKNSFTGKLLKESNEFTLKYRINEKTLYDIILEFKINAKQYVIEKKSVQTSFTI